jgi:hypothetical protein
MVYGRDAGGEDLEVRVQAGQPERGQHGRRGDGQLQDAAEPPGPVAGGHQRGQPAGVATRDAGEVDDDPACRSGKPRSCSRSTGTDAPPSWPVTVATV